MSTLRFGFAQEDITPEPVGFYLDGYGFRNRPADSIRDPLYAKLCVIDDGTPYLVVSLDLGGLSLPYYRMMSERITAVCGIPDARMALCCVHTHSAPSGGILAGIPLNRDYLCHVGEQIGHAALRALERAVPCTADFRILNEPLHCAENRRGRADRDPRIREVSFRDETGKLRGVLCQASCHAVINTTYAMSADFLAVLNTRSTDACPYLYLQSRGADINPSCMTPVEEGLKKLGEDLAFPVWKAAAEYREGVKPEGKLESIFEYVDIPMRWPGTPEEIAADIEATEKEYLSLPWGANEKHYALQKLLWLRHMQDEQASGAPAAVRVPLQVIRLPGVFVFAFVPFEQLTATGNRIEELFVQAGYARERIWVTGYANSVNGYLTPPELLACGDYEAYESARWFDIPNTSPESEPAVVAWFARAAQQA